jgi:hypothetical protein
MADFYRFKIALRSGSGTITVNGDAPLTYYEEGTTLNIAVTLDPGWLSIEWYRLGILISSSISFSITMPSRDTSISGFASGEAVPVDGYGLLFFGEIPDQQDLNTLRLEIYKDGYGSANSEVSIKDISLNFSDNTKKLTDTIIGSSIDFVLLGEPGKYDEFLLGDKYDYRVIVKRNTIPIFDGFLSPDFLEFDDLANTQLFSFIAIDGLKGFDAIKVNDALFPNLKALGAIVSSLNQSFPEYRKVNFLCDIHEDRMDNLDLVFNQFFTPDSSLFPKGEEAKYENGSAIYNENVSIKQVLESLLNPFFCRVFLWDNEFWIVRVPDMYKNSLTFDKYLANGSFDASVTVTGSPDIMGKISPKPRIRAGRVYTEFTATLELGVLDIQAKGAVFEATFENDNWFVGSGASAYSGVFILSRPWEYVNAIPSNQPGSVPSGDTALIQFASDEAGENCKIWTTSTTAGLTDPNLSFISAIPQIGIVDELANKLSFELEFMALPIGSSISNTIGNHRVAFQVRVGDYYLRESATPEVYEFTLTESNCVFSIPNAGVFNTIKITNVVIPTTAAVSIRLYQLILQSGTRHQFAVSYRNLKLSIEENEAFVLSKLGAKGVTTKKYSSVFPEYKINIGDSRTSMSSSAIKLDLVNSPVSESWTAKEFTSLPLLGGIVQDLANVYGRTNRIISGTLHNTEIKPYQPVVYDGSLWIFTNFKWNLHKNTYQFELYELGVIPT